MINDTKREGFNLVSLVDIEHLASHDCKRQKRSDYNRKHYH